MKQTAAYDRETGRARGFGHVDFTTPAAAKKAAAELNGSDLDGRTIKVEVTVPREQRTPGGQQVRVCYQRVVVAPWTMIHGAGGRCRWSSG
jgi:RNA recognition motif-containing protein